MKTLTGFGLSVVLLCAATGYAQQATPAVAPGTDAAPQASSTAKKPTPQPAEPVKVTAKEQKKADKAAAQMAKKLEKAEKANQSVPQ